MMSEETQAAANLAAVATAAAHGERLAVLETHVTGIQKDVKEIRVDVKTLLAHQSSFQGGANLISRAAPWIAVLVSLTAILRTS